MTKEKILLATFVFYIIASIYTYWETRKRANAGFKCRCGTDEYCYEHGA